MKQFLITIPAGKRLIARAVVALGQIKEALKSHTIVIVSGTTNGYIAEELLAMISQTDDFSKEMFFRGINVGLGIMPQKGKYSGTDVVIEKGKWIKEKTIFNVAQSLGKGDIILKGANAIDSERKVAGIQIANPTIGTSGPILQAVIGRRAQLIIPVGLEKRVFASISEIAAKLNEPSSTGLRMLPVSGTIITELEAIKILTGSSAELVAAGGVCGAEGSYWISVTGKQEQVDSASEIINSIANEPPFSG
ncbi:hypothetical protein [Clostridium psychrophilum]|uniref:hypothetical protein n=1 Tax=Clostridium psychrophilum TaxID=132926 RepID=UPI001C0C2F37|nr:hypothetical protein [Clostridium psychrophilum]MBU3179751.1 hypothetical protein [Clostridium psychrophilum]